jgi:hypothetical protein
VLSSCAMEGGIAFSSFFGIAFSDGGGGQIVLTARPGAWQEAHGRGTAYGQIRRSHWVLPCFTASKRQRRFSYIWCNARGPLRRHVDYKRNGNLSIAQTRKIWARPWRRYSGLAEVRGLCVTANEVSIISNRSISRHFLHFHFFCLLCSIVVQLSVSNAMLRSVMLNCCEIECSCGYVFRRMSGAAHFRFMIVSNPIAP